MTAEEALKRLHQETAPCTYNPDFDKEECIRVLEKCVIALGFLKKHIYFTGSKIVVLDEEILKADYELLKEVLYYEINER